MDRQALVRYFSGAPLLIELCSRSGWPDPETLRVEVVEQHPDSVLCNVRFEEVVMDAAGGGVERIDCWGQCRVRLDPTGGIRHAEVVAGRRDEPLD